MYQHMHTQLVNDTFKSMILWCTSTSCLLHYSCKTETLGLYEKLSVRSGLRPASPNPTPALHYRTITSEKGPKGFIVTLRPSLWSINKYPNLGYNSINLKATDW